MLQASWNRRFSGSIYFSKGKIRNFIVVIIISVVIVKRRTTGILSKIKYSH